MKTTGVSALLAGPAPEPDAEALIKEARQRQRRRYLAMGLAVIVVLAGAAGVAASLRRSSHPPRSKPRPAAAARPVSRPPVPAPIPASVDTTVLMWPVGYPAFGPGGGPPAYVDDLSTGRLSQSERPAISAGDWQPLLAVVGRWLVYVGNGVTAVRDDLTGMPRVLGGDGFFAPAATPDHVWLVHYAPSGPVSVQLVAVTGGSPGQPITLPHGSQLIEGTDAGLLLQDRRGDVELWNPGAEPRRLPFSPAWSDGFDANAQLVAYGTDCSDENVASGAPYEPQAFYASCGVLRVFNVITGRLFSFPAPAGTTGWVPYEFNLAHPIAPGNSAMAAEAVIPSPHADTGRLYVLRLTASHLRPVAVPDSTGFVITKTAWSASGSWVFYQGPGEHMWAYQVTTGRVRSSRTPCCQYTVMVAVRSPGR